MITVYTKPNCMQCEFTKRYLDESGVKYSTVDVTQDEVALQMLKLHKHQGVPVVAVNGFEDSWSGFKPDRLDELKEVQGD